MCATGKMKMKEENENERRNWTKSQNEYILDQQQVNPKKQPRMTWKWKMKILYLTFASATLFLKMYSIFAYSSVTCTHCCTSEYFLATLPSANKRENKWYRRYCSKAGRKNRPSSKNSVANNKKSMVKIPIFHDGNELIALSLRTPEKHKTAMSFCFYVNTW